MQYSACEALWLAVSRMCRNVLRFLLFEVFQQEAIACLGN